MLSFDNTLPFGHQDSSHNGSHYLGVQELGRMAPVCRLWNAWLGKESVVWRNASQHDKIPVVEGGNRDYRKELQQIKPLISSIHGLLGRVLGPVPPISQEMFQKFTSGALDPFRNDFSRYKFMLLINPTTVVGPIPLTNQEIFQRFTSGALDPNSVLFMDTTTMVGSAPPTNQEMFERFTSAALDPSRNGSFRDNFVLFIDPSYIERRVDKDTPLALEGDRLVEVPVDKVVEQTLKIPASFPNLLLLAKFPLKRKEHLLVYRIFDDILDAVIKQCGDFPKKVGVRAMRKFVQENTRNIDFALQQAIIQQSAPNEGYTAESVRRRFLFDAERILTTETCPDVQAPRITYVRCKETIVYYGTKSNLVIGGFIPDGGGVRIDNDIVNGHGYEAFAVVPGCSAEDPRPLELEFGDLAIDGH